MPIQWKRTPGSGDCKCKGPEAGTGLAGSGNSVDSCIQTSVEKAASRYLLSATLLARWVGVRWPSLCPQIGEADSGTNRDIVSALSARLTARFPANWLYWTSLHNRLFGVRPSPTPPYYPLDPGAMSQLEQVHHRTCPGSFLLWK